MQAFDYLFLIYLNDKNVRIVKVTITKSQKNLLMTLVFCF